MSKTEEPSYLSILENDYINRKKKNPSYSIRAFALKLDLSPAYISLLFKKKRHLSVKNAIKICQKLNWSTSEQNYFMHLLQFEKAESEQIKQLALQEIVKHQSNKNKKSSVEIDASLTLSAWYYNAILAFLTLKNVKTTTLNISNRLGISLLETKKALQHLQKLDLIRKKNTQWVNTENLLHIRSQPSENIRQYHKNILSIAAKSIDLQKFENKDFSNMTLTVDTKNLDKAKQKIAEFQFEMAQLLDTEKSTAVYQLSIQLFSLTKQELPI